jgi:hypothetical protein
MNKKELWAKAPFLRLFNNPELKFGVIDNEFIMDFSPKQGVFIKTLKASFIKKIVIFKYSFFTLIINLFINAMLKYYICLPAI